MKKMIFDQAVEGEGDGGEYHDTDEMERRAEKEESVMVKSKPMKKSPVSLNRKRTQSPAKRKQEE